MNNSMKVDTQEDLKPQEWLFLWKSTCELPKYENEIRFFFRKQEYTFIPGWDCWMF